MELRPPGMDPLDDKVRSRLAEIRAAAGVPHSQIALEVLYFLPRGFIQAYGDLFTRAVKSDGGEDSRARQQTDGAVVGKVAVRKTGAGPTVGGGGKRYKKTFTVMDEHALEVKNRLDKRLRQMAREIMEELMAGPGGRKATARAQGCTGCGMFLHTAWKYCPTCGEGRTEG